VVRFLKRDPGIVPLKKTMILRSGLPGADEPAAVGEKERKQSLATPGAILDSYAETR